jgi:hypothetical protein
LSIAAEVGLLETIGRKGGEGYSRGQLAVEDDGCRKLPFGKKKKTMNQRREKRRENTRKGEIGMKLLSDVVDQSNVSNKAVAA